MFKVKSEAKEEKIPFMQEGIEQDIVRAKRLTYHHPNWFIGGQKSVYDAIQYFASSGDFVIDIPRTLYRDYQKTGYDGEKTSTAFVNWLIKNKKYEYLVIRYAGCCGA
ncbi:hypothetical protein CCP3SC1AL1_2210001 [Gammaproteobacteria bacterium]